MRASVRNAVRRVPAAPEGVRGAYGREPLLCLPLSPTVRQRLSATARGEIWEHPRQAIPALAPADIFPDQNKARVSLDAQGAESALCAAAKPGIPAFAPLHLSMETLNFPRWL